MRILVVEDEKRLADTLCEILTYNKYIADAAYDGETGLDDALSGIYDVIILDVMMPKMNGFQVVRELRNKGVSTPVLMLTARSETSYKVEGLDCGADYYLTKPFETEELLACLRALMRRQDEIIPDVISYKSLSLNLSSYELSCGELAVRLSQKEFEIMRMLITSGGNPVPKEAILVKVWGYDSEAEDNHVEVYISFLRKKMAHIHSSVTIESMRFVGYYLREK